MTRVQELWEGSALGQDFAAGVLGVTHAATKLEAIGTKAAARGRGVRRPSTAWPL